MILLKFKARRSQARPSAISHHFNHTHPPSSFLFHRTFYIVHRIKISNSQPNPITPFYVIFITPSSGIIVFHHFIWFK